MTETPTDSLFKLRLPGPMREKLEAEAAIHGRTLTAEILHRLESTFSGVERRLEELEKKVFDEEIGNEELSRIVWKLVSAFESNIGRLSDY